MLTNLEPRSVLRSDGLDHEWHILCHGIPWLPDLSMTQNIPSHSLQILCWFHLRPSVQCVPVDCCVCACCNTLTVCFDSLFRLPTLRCCPSSIVNLSLNITTVTHYKWWWHAFGRVVTEPLSSEWITRWKPSGIVRWMGMSELSKARWKHAIITTSLIQQ